MSEQSLYERLGGVFAVAPWSTISVMRSSRTQSWARRRRTPHLREWHTLQLGRLPGLKFMRTLWVCNVAGGPFTYVGTHPGRDEVSLEEAHRRFSISPEEFDEVAAELGRTLDAVGVPAQEKGEVLAAFAAHKGEVTEGFLVAAGH